MIPQTRDDDLNHDLTDRHAYETDDNPRPSWWPLFGTVIVLNLLGAGATWLVMHMIATGRIW